MNRKTILSVGGPRNSHGTRISKLIKCDNCGSRDHITARPNKYKNTYCRTCALIFMNALETGKKLPKNMIKHKCENCMIIFEMPANIRKNKKWLCQNCIRGHAIWRGSLTMTPQERSSIQYELRTSGVILRKNS